jgi:hypothetical protein
MEPAMPANMSFHIYVNPTRYMYLTSLATALQSSTLIPAPMRTWIHKRWVSLRQSFSDFTSENMTSLVPVFHRNRSGMPPPRCRYSCAMTLQTIARDSPRKHCAISMRSSRPKDQSIPTTQVCLGDSRLWTSQIIRSASPLVISTRRWFISEARDM